MTLGYFVIALITDVHAKKPHCGQQMVAGRLRALLHSNIHPSEITG